MDFDLLDELEGLRDEDLQPEPEGGHLPKLPKENSSVPRARYWWEEGYEAPEIKIDATERVWNTSTNCYEDQPKPRRRIVAQGPSDDEHDNQEKIASLDEILDGLDKASLEESTPLDDYRSRPVPKRVWNPRAGAYEEVDSAGAEYQGGWLLKEESSLALLNPTEKLEDLLKTIDMEDHARESLNGVDDDTLDREMHVEVQSALDMLSTTSECPVWSRNLFKTPPDMESMLEKYALTATEEHTLNDDIGDMFHVERAKEVEELKRKHQRAAVEEMRLEEANSNRQMGKQLVHTSRSVRLGDLPKAKEKLPGVRMQKLDKHKQLEKTSSSSSSSSRVANNPQTHRLDFTMLPGMTLPGELHTMASTSSTSSQLPPSARESGTFALAAGVDGELVLPKEPNAFSKTTLRSKKMSNKLGDGSIDHCEALGSDRCLSDKVMPNFQDLLTRLDHEIDDQTEQ